MTWHQGRVIYFELVRYRKMLPVVAGWRVSEVERYILAKDESRKLFRVREAEETKTAHAGPSQ